MSVSKQKIGMIPPSVSKGSLVLEFLGFFFSTNSISHNLFYYF